MELVYNAVILSRCASPKDNSECLLQLPEATHDLSHAAATSQIFALIVSADSQTTDRIK